MCISRASVATEFHDNANPRLSTPATSARSTRRQLMVAFISSIEQIRRLTFCFFVFVFFFLIFGRDFLWILWFFFRDFPLYFFILSFKPNGGFFSNKRRWDTVVMWRNAGEILFFSVVFTRQRSHQHPTTSSSSFLLFLRSANGDINKKDLVNKFF